MQRNEILRSQSGERPRRNGEDTATTAPQCAPARRCAIKRKSGGIRRR